MTLITPEGLQDTDPVVVPHLSVAERIARGRSARAEVPRSSHGPFTPLPHRPDPVDLLERQAESRLPELVPIRYGRMSVSPFTFYRGGALLMASDLAATPRSGFRVQVCGDAHLSNFGVFGSPERRLVFDLNDFDETQPGPWEWDIKRLAASLSVAGRNNGFAIADREVIVRAAAASYREAIRRFAKMPNLAVWYSRFEVEEQFQQITSQLDPKRVKRLEKDLAKARTRDSTHAAAKLTHLVDGEPRIISDPPLIVPIEEVAAGHTSEQIFEELHILLRAYRASLQPDRRVLLEQYKFVHMARKVVGVGSVGTRAWIALLVGLDERDPLLLQFKEAQPSVLEEFVGSSGYENNGQRVVAGQHLMQSSSDIFLGWQRAIGIDGVARDFYGRQLKDWKGSIDPEAMVPDGMALYAQLCGWTLARAHARSGDRVAIAAYLGGGDVFDRAIVEFAESYADQNERDYQAFIAAIESGRLEARTGL